MKVITAFAAVLGLVISSQVYAQEAPLWQRTITPDGGASAELPCAANHITLRMGDTVGASRCDWAGITFYLVVLPNGYTRFGGDRVSFEALRAEMVGDELTAFSLTRSIRGFDAFYAEGVATSEAGFSVGTGVVDLGEDGVAMLVAASDGSSEAQSLFSQTLARVWESLEVTL